MIEIPENIKAWKRKGTVIKVVNDSYFLYSNSSCRVKGKKNPQPIQKYIGLITENGVIESFDINTHDSGIEVSEYGFTKSVLSLTREEFIKILKSNERAMKVIKCLICSFSPSSYLVRECKDICESDIKTSLPLQKKKWEEICGYTFESLYALFSSIYLLKIGEREVISNITSSQRSKAKEMGIEL